MLRILAFVGFLCAATTGAKADWILNNDLSRLSFVSIKAGDTGEAHYFRELEGRITEAGEVGIQVDLASVETLIDLRNERMINFLFEVTDFATAEVMAEVDPASWEDLAPGETRNADVEASLSLHGFDEELYLELQVVRPAPDRVTISSRAPVILDAAWFGMSEGITRLAELASLDSISSAVPVTFLITFDRETEQD